jgi:serine/threonine protein kinase/tetratricopeptide (TPR) repeat protein
MPTNRPLSPTPQKLAAFELIRRLGAGGMAEVFLAKKRGAEGTYKVLVVKRILPSYGASLRFRTMFVEEAQLATRLNHPNVVQVYEFFDGGDEGQLLAMEYVEGPDLGRLLSSAKAKGQRIDPWTAAWIVAEAAKGLHYAHERKDEGGAPLEIVHRDVSPQNVLLSFEGSVKIADFGIATAKLFAPDQGVLKGKFGYMSPEQARGEKVDRRSDLYALGVILWEALTGRPLHGALRDDALLDVVRSGVVEPPSTFVPDVPPELEAIVVKALAPAREDRFANGRELAAAIGRALLVKQVLVDATTLEAVIAEFVVRENTRPGLSELPPPGLAPVQPEGPAGNRTIAAVPMALGGGAHPVEVSVEEDAPFEPLPPVSEHVAPSHLTPVDRTAAPAPGPREVRHVAIVTLRLHGLDVSEAGASAGRARTVERLRTMLGDIAYKREMRWVWSSESEARAIAGLGSNPARAAADAAWLALDSHEALSGIREDLAVPIGAALGIVRGIASGTRDAQGHLVRHRLHDPATFLADTLARETPVHRTWVAGGVYRLVRHEFGWGDAATLDLSPPKGLELPRTMRTYALERSLSRGERRGEDLDAPSDLVGRDLEKAELVAAYHRAVTGGSGGEFTCRVVTGELGIGKTALVASFAAELPPDARVARVECSPVRQELPLSAVALLVRDLIGLTGEESFDEVCALIARAGGRAGAGDVKNPIVASLAELVTTRQSGFAGDEDDVSRRRAVTRGVRHLFAAVAMLAPLVVIFEGLQWADKPSLEILAEIARAGDPLPILLVLVTRPDDRLAPLLEGVVCIELRGLTTEEQIHLVELRLDVDDGVRQVCADLMPRVAGNPFFLLEMIDALLERGTLEIRESAPDDGGTGEARHTLVRTAPEGAGGMSLPSTLERLLADRLSELPPEERMVVEWLAIAGGPLSTQELATLLHVTSEEAIMRLCARGLCDRKGDAIDFRHLLTRDVAYGALGAATRARMHRALGELLAEGKMAHGLSAAIVAQHFVRGEDGMRATDFYLEAAQAARASYQTPQAIRYYKRAVASMPALDPRAIIAHDALEAIHRDAGRRRERVVHLEALRRIGKASASPRAVCLALLRTARFDADEGKLARGLPISMRAAEVARMAGLTTLEVEAEALTSLLQSELGDVQGALAACDRALAACDPKVYPNMPARARAEVLLSRGALLRWVGRVAEAVDSYVDAIAVFRRTGARRLEARAKNSLAYAMFVQGRYEDAITLALASLQIDVAIGGRFQIAKTLANVGFAYARLGDTARANAYFARARDAHERYSDQDGRGETLLVSAQVMIEQGELQLADSFVRDAAALNAVMGSAYQATHEAVVRAILARARREPGEAVLHAVRARRLAEDLALVSFHFYALALEAAARVDTGEIHAAVLLATTALGAVETLQGCEFGLEIRVLAADALKRAGSPQAPLAQQRAADYAATLMATIRDPRLRTLFARRPLLAALLDATPVPQEPSGTSSPS